MPQDRVFPKNGREIYLMTDRTVFGGVVTAVLRVVYCQTHVMTWTFDGGQVVVFSLFLALGASVFFARFHVYQIPLQFVHFFSTYAYI